MKYIFLGLLSLFLFGCDEAKEISYSELIELSKTWKEPKVAIWYYQGSDNTFHYFQHIDLGTKDQYAVIKSSFKINEQTISKDVNDWLVMPWGPQTIAQ